MEDIFSASFFVYSSMLVSLTFLGTVTFLQLLIKSSMFSYSLLSSGVTLPDSVAFWSAFFWGSYSPTFLCDLFLLCLCLSLSLLYFSVELPTINLVQLYLAVPETQHWLWDHMNVHSKILMLWNRTWINLIGQKRNETFRQPGQILNCKPDLYQFYKSSPTCDCRVKKQGGDYIIFCVPSMWFMQNTSSDHSIFWYKHCKCE